MKPIEYETPNHIVDITDNEIYDEEFEDEEDNFTFRNKTKKLIRPEKSASIEIEYKPYISIFVPFLTLCLVIKWYWGKFLAIKDRFYQRLLSCCRRTLKTCTLNTKIWLKNTRGFYQLSPVKWKPEDEYLLKTNHGFPWIRSYTHEEAICMSLVQTREKLKSSVKRAKNIWVTYECNLSSHLR